MIRIKEACLAITLRWPKEGRNDEGSSWTKAGRGGEERIPDVGMHVCAGH